MQSEKEVQYESFINDVEDNMREKLKYVPSKLDSMVVEALKDVPLVNSGLPSDTFNTAFGGSIDETVAHSVFAYYQKRNYPMAWWIGPSSEGEQVKQWLQNAGFIHDELDIGMVCDLTKPLMDYEGPVSLSIRRCTKAQEFHDFGDVLASVFDPKDEQVIKFYDQMASLSLEAIEDMVLFVGYEGDVPVSTSCLFFTDVAGIYDLATRPDKRNLGYGSAMFYHTLVEAKNRGLKEGVLQASPDGLNIYKRFGFKELCEFNVWSNGIK